MTPHVAQKLFDEIQQAELAFQLKGTPHAEYLRTRRHRHLGQARRELDRIVALGTHAGTFVSFFLAEFGVQ
jgi:hypothetical protein